MCRNEAIFDNPNRVCRLVIERKMRFCFDCVWVVGFWATSINLSASSFVEFGALKTGADGLHYTEGVDEPFTGRSVEYYPDGTKRNLYRGRMDGKMACISYGMKQPDGKKYRLNTLMI